VVFFGKWEVGSGLLAERHFKVDGSRENLKSNLLTHITMLSVHSTKRGVDHGRRGVRGSEGGFKIIRRPLLFVFQLRVRK